MINQKYGPIFILTIFSLIVIQCFAEKVDLKKMPNYSTITLNRSDLNNYIPEYIANQITANLDFIDSMENSLLKFADIYPSDEVFRFTQYEFFLSKAFMEAYGVWNEDALNSMLSEFDNLFNINSRKLAFWADSLKSKAKEDRLDSYNQIIDSLLSLESTNKNIWSISITKQGVTLLTVYYQPAKNKLNIPGSFLESEVMIIIPQVFSIQKMTANHNEIGIRRMDKHIHVYYPNYRSDFGIDIIYIMD